MPDSVWQLAQGRIGVFNDWHPPVMAWMLGLADRLMAGAPLFFVFDTMLFFGALAAVIALTRRPGLPALAVVALIAASPLVLIYQGLILKDILFADAAATGFAALAWAGRCWDTRPIRFGAIAIALSLLTLAALSRQNGAVAAVGGALALGVMAAKGADGPGKAALRASLVSGVALALIVLAGGAVSYGLELRGDHSPETARQITTLQLYDLTGAVRRAPALSLPALDRDAPALERFLRHDAVPAYNPSRADPIAMLPPWPGFVAHPGPGPARAWRGLITGAPWLYLKVRAQVFWQVLMTPDIEKCAPVLTGVDAGDPDRLRQAGLTLRESDKDDWDSDYAAAFLKTPVFSHGFYGALAVVLLILNLRDLRRGGGRETIAMAALLASALAFTASFFVISIACDYRYLYFLDAAAMIALAHRAASWTPARLAWPRHRGRPPRPG